MAATTSTLSTVIREQYVSGFHEAVFYNDELMGMASPSGGRLFPVVGNAGDTAHRWKVHSAGNGSVATYSENDAAPDAGNNTFVNLALDFTYIWATVQYTGHLGDSLESQWFDGLEQEMLLAKRGMVDLFTTTFLNDATVGLQNAIDDDSTYAGQARGSASWFESYNSSSVGAIANDDYITAEETVSGASYGGRLKLWMLPRNQITNYAGIQNLTGSGMVRDVGISGGKGLDHGFNPDAMSAGGIPMKRISDLTTTVALGLDTRPGELKLVVRRPFRVEELGKTSDARKFLLTMALAMPVENPIHHCKLEGITA